MQRKWLARKIVVQFSGGYTATGSYSARNTVDKFPFATDTNATDVGDLTGVREGPTGTQF